MHIGCPRSEIRVSVATCNPRQLSFIVLYTLFLAACATTAPRAPLRQAATHDVAPVARDKDLPLKLIGAELALQRNDLAGGARGYSEAAQLSADPAIAEQATRLAIAVEQWSLARQSLARWQMLDADAAGILQARAWIALSEGDVETAFSQLEALTRRASGNAWRPVAQVLLGAADKKLAQSLLARLATPPRLGNKEQDWIAMSQLAFKLGDKALAGKLSADAVARFKSGDAYAWSAQLALDSGDKAAARERFQNALKRDPSSLRLRTGYAALLADGGDNAGAARALAAGAQTDVTYGARAAYVSRANDKAMLAALYREIEADKSERGGKRIFLLGQLAEILGKTAQALDWYREVPEDDERWLDAGIRSVVLTDQAGDTDAAFERISQLRIAAGAESREAVDLVLLEADLYARKSRASDAVAAYSRGLDQYPGEPRLLYARAMLAIEGDDFARGERDLRAIIAADPENAEAMNALGYTLADRNDRVAEAQALIEKALALKPDEPAIVDSYGWVLYRRGQLDEAITQLRRAYALQPDAEIAAHLGEILWAKGERAEAKRVWEEGMAKDAKNRVLLETMRRLIS